MSIAIYTLTSPLHDKEAIAASTKEFLDSLDFPFEFKGEDFKDWSTNGLNLIFVRTGGTENLFRQQRMNMHDIQSPVYLLSNGTNNSLAASMEILSWLRQSGQKGEILHGTPEYISERVKVLSLIQAARKRLSQVRAAIIGKPSDWLIASSVIDRDEIKRRLGFEISKIELEEVEKAYAGHSANSKEAERLKEVMLKADIAEGSSCGGNISGAIKIYDALRKVIAEHNVNAFTIRCFDLLSSLKNTGCTALAKLNSEGIVAGCEGDAPAMLSMIISQCLTQKTGFQANPAMIDTDKGEVLFAHCTIPLNMVEKFELDTHFESGIGVGIRGFMKEGPVTVFKVSGDLQRQFIEEGQLISNGKASNLCRTQQLIRFTDKDATRYFLQNPIGNHHIIIPGHWKKPLEELLS